MSRFGWLCSAFRLDEHVPGSIVCLWDQDIPLLPPLQSFPHLLLAQGDLPLLRTIPHIRHLSLRHPLLLTAQRVAAALVLNENVTVHLRSVTCLVCSGLCSALASLAIGVHVT